MAANPVAADRTMFITALAFAVCHLAGFVLLGELLGSFGDADTRFEEYYASRGNQVASLLGAALLLAGAVLLLGFFSQLAGRSDRHERVALGFGMAAALMGTSLLAAAAASLGATGGARKFGFGDTGQLMGSEGALPQLGFVLVVCSLVPVAASMVSFGYRAHRCGSAGPWFARGTTVSAVLVVVASVSVIVPMFVLPGWVILTATRVGRSSTV